MNRTWMSVITGSLLFIGANGQAGTIPEHVDINLQNSNPTLATSWKDSKEVKSFNHRGHIKILTKAAPDKETCLTCHKEANSQEEIQAENRKEKQAALVNAAGSVKKYMHSQCLSCHKTMKKQKETTGPTSCKGCH